jgi:hypothetical protein
MPLPTNLRLLIEWAPALQLLSAVGAAKPGVERMMQIVKLAEFLTTKTSTGVDDRLVRLLTDILLTPQGQALVDYVCQLVTAVEFSNESARPVGA